MTDPDIREQQLRDLDAKINARGFQIDTRFAQAAAELDINLKRIITTRLAELTGETERDRILRWLSARTGEQVSAGDSETMKAIADRHPDVAPVCSAISAVAVVSTGKFRKMLECADPDGRVRNAFVYDGAHTGRWSSEGVQVHNLPRTDENYMRLRPCVTANDADWWYMLYGNAARSILSSFVRTAITAPEGRCLHVADFSAIEPRVLAWLAGERWKLKAYAGGGRIYEETAGMIFGIDPTRITKDSPARAAGKIAELSLGYAGGKNALVRMGRKYGIDFSGYDGDIIVEGWRRANPMIVGLWKALEEGAAEAFTSGRPTYIYGTRLKLEREGDDLTVTLPSGRKLIYERFQPKPLSYVARSTSSRVRLYGGKITENIVQAVARDILAEAMLRLDSKGHEIIMHVHDEIVVESDDPTALADILQEMAVAPLWATALPLKAEGYTSEFYKK